MAGFSDYIEPYVLNAIFRNDAASVPAIPNIYVKLHVGDPGESGANNPAAETTRQAVTFNAAAGGTIASSAAVNWTNVSTTETITYISLWDNLTAGNCLGTAQLNVSAVLSAGDDLGLTAITFTLD